MSVIVNVYEGPKQSKVAKAPNKKQSQVTKQVTAKKTSAAPAATARVSWRKRRKWYQF